MVVDVHRLIPQLIRGDAIVETGFVIKRHIFCGTKILGKFLCHMETCVGICHYLKAINLATLGGDEDGTLGTLRAKHHDSLSSLEKGDLFYFRGKHVVGRTLHTIDDDKRKVAIVVGVKTVIVHSP